MQRITVNAAPGGELCERARSINGAAVLPTASTTGWAEQLNADPVWTQNLAIAFEIAAAAMAEIRKAGVSKC